MAMTTKSCLFFNMVDREELIEKTILEYKVKGFKKQRINYFLFRASKSEKIKQNDLLAKSCP